MPWAGTDATLFWSSGLPSPFGAHLLAHLLLLHGLLPQGLLPYAYITLLGPAWSLSTEWQFYLLIGLLAPKHLGRFALALAALSALYHILPLPPWWQFSRAFLPEAAAYFALGIASAILLRTGSAKCFTLCLLAACALAALNGAAKTLVPFAWAAVMLAQNHRFGALLEHRAALTLGAISYPLYLLNEPIQRALALPLVPLAHANATLFTALWLPPALLLPIAAAALLHHAVELPFQHHNHKFSAPRIAPSLPQ
jgi:peptidoglycan/LPS O-acetylase OafA/YrhL